MMHRIEELIETACRDATGRSVLLGTDGVLRRGEFWQRAGRLAGELERRAGEGAEAVGILLPNGPGLVVGVVSVLVAGKVVVPLGERRRPDELRRVARAAGIRAMITERTWLHLLRPWFGGAVLLLDGEASVVEAFDGHPPDEPSRLTHDHAAVFLTSGTSGTPKIVALTHDNILSNLRSEQRCMPFAGRGRSYVYLPLFHSYAFTLQMLAALCGPGQLHLASALPFGAALVEEIERSGCDTLFGVPPFFRLLGDGVARLGRRDGLTRVKHLVNGAAMMTEPVLAGLERDLPGARLFLTYGLSEASPLVTCLPPELASTKRCSIGRAVPGVQLRLKNVSPPASRHGEVGEILIRGTSVIEGYLDNPQANEKSFNNGWLCTGDVAAVDVDGCLFLRGRIKDVINRAGETLYPEEIEAVIRALPGVADVAVTAAPHPILEQVPRAFVQVEPGAGAVDPDDIVRRCAEALPPSMVPQQVTLVDELPRTASGKVLKRLLDDVRSGEM